ncbi:MAG TPA: hypothetical protein VIN07_07805 [Flavipsychrobacter sp.]
MTCRHLVFLLLFPVVSFAQSEELLKRIAYAQTISRLRYEKKYDSIVHIGRSIPFRDSIYLYGIEATVAHAYMQLGDTVNAMKYLERSVELQQYGERGQISYSFKKYKLDSNARYQRVIRKFDKLNSRYAGNLNMPVLNRCLEIYYTDQRVRNIWMIQGDSTKKAYADFVQRQCDSMNVAAMSSLMKDIGRFPGISDIGLSFLWNFRHIIAHWAGELNRDTLVSYLKEATLNGQIPNTYGPFILDKLEHYKGNPSIYGEYGDYNDYKDGIRHIKPIRDIEYVDQRRAEFLLPPLFTLQEMQNCALPAGYSRKSQKPIGTQ